jgi:hypothetical protein
MATKLTRLTHKIAIQLHLVAKSCTNCSFHSTRPVRKLVDTPSCVCVYVRMCVCVCVCMYVCMYVCILNSSNNLQPHWSLHREECANLTKFPFPYYMLSLSLLFDSSVGIAPGYGLDDRGFESRQWLGIFLFTTMSRPALRPTQPPIQWVPRAISLGIKRSGGEIDHSPPSSAEVKNAWSYTSTPSFRLHGVVLS